MKSISGTQKKRGRPATGETPRVGVRLADDMRAAIDAYIADQPAPPPSVSDAVRSLLAAALRARGYLPSGDDG